MANRNFICPKCGCVNSLKTPRYDMKINNINIYRRYVGGTHDIYAEDVTNVCLCCGYIETTTITSENQNMLDNIEQALENIVLNPSFDIETPIRTWFDKFGRLKLYFLQYIDNEYTWNDKEYKLYDECIQDLYYLLKMYKFNHDDNYVVSSSTLPCVQYHSISASVDNMREYVEEWNNVKRIFIPIPRNSSKFYTCEDIIRIVKYSDMYSNEAFERFKSDSDNVDVTTTTCGFSDEHEMKSIKEYFKDDNSVIVSNIGTDEYSIVSLVYEIANVKYKSICILLKNNNEGVVL